jgi:hypothetical protein
MKQYVIVYHGLFFAEYHNGLPWFTILSASAHRMSFDEATRELSMICGLGYGGDIVEVER